jgi:hypothetical protein
MTEPRRRTRNEIVGWTEHSSDAHDVAEARNDCIATADLSDKILAAQRQEVGLYYRQSRIIRDARGESAGRPRDRAHPDPAGQKLLQDASPRAPCASDEKNRLFCGHHRPLAS